MAIKNEAMINESHVCVEGANHAHKQLIQHFSYMYGHIIMESLWRFPYAKRRELIKTYPAYYEEFPTRKQDLLTFFAYHFPTALNTAIFLGKPILYMMLHIHRRLKNN